MGSPVEPSRGIPKDSPSRPKRKQMKRKRKRKQVRADLDKVSLQLHFSWARGSNRAHQPAFVDNNTDSCIWVENLGFGLGSDFIPYSNNLHRLLILINLNIT
jgi:hypothetical protein